MDGCIEGKVRAMDQAEIIRLLGTICIVASAVLANAFVITYQIISPWRDSDMGRHIMNFGLVIALILDLWITRLFFGEGQEWFNWIRLAAFAGLPYVLFRQIRMLIKVQILDRRKEKEQTID